MNIPRTKAILKYLDFIIIPGEGENDLVRTWTCHLKINLNVNFWFIPLKFKFILFCLFFCFSKRFVCRLDQLTSWGLDYYDSINANSKNRGSPMYQVQQQQPHSPVDSLERSLPSVAYHYHRRVVVNQQQQQRDNRSYNSQSSAGSSTTPSNSLSYHPWVPLFCILFHVLFLLLLTLKETTQTKWLYV